MSNGDQGFDPNQVPDFEQLADQVAAGLVKHGGVAAFWSSAFRPLLDLLAGALGLVLALITEIVAFLAKLIVKSLETARPEVQELATVALEEVFGGSFSGGGSDRFGGAAAAKALGQNVVRALGAAGGGGGGDGLTPSTAPAETFLGELLAVAVRGWVLALITEIETLGRLDAFNELTEDVIGALGIGRLTRQALRPAIDITIAQPAAQFFNLEYRPTLLSEGLAVKQFLRGRWGQGELDAELGKRGYSPARIEALVNDARKFAPLTDLDRLVRGESVTYGEFLIEAKNQGYTDTDAQIIHDAAHLARMDAIVKEQLGAYTGLLRAGELTFEQWRSFVDQLDLAADEKAQYTVVAQIIADHPRRPIALADLRAMFTKNIISLGEFRDHLVRLGFSEENATLLELLEQRTLADHAAAQTEKARIKTEKAAAAAQKKADAAAAAAQKKADLLATRQAHQAFINAKQQAAADAAIARATFTADTIRKRHQLIDQAAKDKLLTELEATQARAQLKIAEQTHAAQLAAETQSRTVLDQEQVKIDAAAVQAKITAERAAATTTRAKARVALDQQLLDARAADRVAGFQLARQSATDSFDAGEITAAALAKKLRAIDLQEKKAIADENLATIKAHQAQAVADAQIAAGALPVSALEEKAGLLPAATRAHQDAIQVALADHLTLISDTGASTTAALADLASRRQAAADRAASARDTLDAQLEQQRIELERQIQAGKPKPPA